MSTQVDKNVQIYKDKENPEEEINHSYANGFISEKEKSYKKEKPSEHKHATFAPCSLTELGQSYFHLVPDEYNGTMESKYHIKEEPFSTLTKPMS